MLLLAFKFTLWKRAEGAIKRLSGSVLKSFNGKLILEGGGSSLPEVYRGSTHYLRYLLKTLILWKNIKPSFCCLTT